MNDSRNEGGREGMQALNRTVGRGSSWEAEGLALRIFCEQCLLSMLPFHTPINDPQPVKY